MRNHLINIYILKEGINMIFLKKEPKIMAQEITTDIRRAIANGIIKPGEKINETQIARDMGISRSPVRDCLLYTSDAADE